MFKKSIIMGVAAIGAMSLVGTGFAGWVISKTAVKESEGNIIAYAAADESVDLTVTPDISEIVFGVPTDYTSSKATDWLIPENESDGAMKKDAMTVKFTVSATAHTGNKTPYNCIQLELPDLPADVVVRTITFPQGAEIQEDGLTVYNYQSTSFDVIVSYAWAFPNGANPYTYYNGQTYTDNLAKDALDKLTDLDNAVAEHKFKITVKSSTAKMDTNTIFAPSTGA